MGNPWFGAKDYGVGLSPKGRGGWACLAVYVLAMAAAPPIVRHFGAPRPVVLIVLGVLTVIFVAVAFIKSDRQPWRWRWGGR